LLRRGVMRALLALVPLLVVACSSAPEKETPIASGLYVLEQDPGTLMFIDEEGYFSWHVNTCGDWLHDDRGSLEREADGSVHIFACSTHPEGGAVWAPYVAATKLRARVTDTGFVVEGTLKSGQSFTQDWRRDGACRSQCGCDPPEHRTGC
jgi:hypothetical protein